jgi:hypothetical protein
MWMLKGTLVGLGLFFTGTLVYLFFKTKPHEEHTATAVSALLAWTLNNPWWWMALVATLAVSCWFFKMYEPGATMVVGGVLFVFGIFVVALVALILLTRGVGGVEFPVSFVTKLGPFLIGCGIGSTVIGFGLWIVGRAAAASLARHLAK